MRLRTLVVLAITSFVPACIVHVHDGSVQTIGLAEPLSATAQRETELPLALSAGQKLELSTKTGSVVVRAGGAASPRARAKLTMNARDDEEARTALERFDVAAVETLDGWKLEVRGEPLVVHSGTQRIELTPRVDFELDLPAGVRLDARSGSGDLSATGALAATLLETNYGSIAADGVRGALTASTKSGAVRVARVEGDLEARSSYGSVEAADISGSKIVVASSSGNVALRGARAESINAETKYGSVEVRDARGALVAKSGSGNVTGEALEGATLLLHSNYGQIAVRGAKGALDLHSSSGNVRISEGEGALKAHSNYGALEAEGVWNSVQASSSSGTVAVRALGGSARTGEWSLSSGYGSVKLAVPDDFTCALDAVTNYGSASCAFPVTIEAGARSKDGRLVGQIGNGGPRVTLRSKSGDVVLDKLRSQ
ncbi:MAG: DUF4097 family beta strand repeat protein [Planctomycetes bacterium]|nr:DUF4097 family beta strand repeat protein [Planctomycetota bacterium]